MTFLQKTVKEWKNEETDDIRYNFWHKLDKYCFQHNFACPYKDYKKIKYYEEILRFFVFEIKNDQILDENRKHIGIIKFSNITW